MHIQKNMKKNSYFIKLFSFCITVLISTTSWTMPPSSFSSFVPEDRTSETANSHQFSASTSLPELPIDDSSSSDSSTQAPSSQNIQALLAENAYLKTTLDAMAETTHSLTIAIREAQDLLTLKESEFKKNHAELKESSEQAKFEKNFAESLLEKRTLEAVAIQMTNINLSRELETSRAQIRMLEEIVAKLMRPSASHENEKAENFLRVALGQQSPNLYRQAYEEPQESTQDLYADSPTLAQEGYTGFVASEQEMCLGSLPPTQKSSNLDISDLFIFTWCLICNSDVNNKDLQEMIEGIYSRYNLNLDDLTAMYKEQMDPEERVYYENYTYKEHSLVKAAELQWTLMLRNKKGLSEHDIDCFLQSSENKIRRARYEKTLDLQDLLDAQRDPKIKTEISRKEKHTKSF